MVFLPPAARREIDRRSSPDMASQPPALDILVREPDGFSVWSGPPYPTGSAPPVRLPKTACSATYFSSDGSRLLATVV